MLDGDAVAASQQWVYLRQGLLQLVLLAAVAVSKGVHCSSGFKGRARLSETGARRVTRTEFLCFIQTHQIQSTSLHKDFMLLIPRYIFKLSLPQLTPRQYLVPVHFDHLYMVKEDPFVLQFQNFRLEICAVCCAHFIYRFTHLSAIFSCFLLRFKISVLVGCGGKEGGFYTFRQYFLHTGQAISRGG